MSTLAQCPPDVPRSRACVALGLARTGTYPRPSRRADRPKKGQPRALSGDERREVLAVFHDEANADKSPRQICAEAQTEGRLLPSISTCYRILADEGESGERRNQRPPQRHAMPSLTADAPNQVWCWDITKLPTLSRGWFLNLYLILDLYSRFVVGWMISRKENAGLAKHLFGQTLKAHGVAPSSLVVHQDRGAPMTAHSFRELLESFGAQASYSRPRVSNDNAFSEACFKTLKYAPRYPGRFVDRDDAVAWVREFIEDYQQRPHGGLNHFTPEDVYRGRTGPILAARQATQDAYYAEHPNRFVHGPPRVKGPPRAVCLNPLNPLPADQLLDDPSARRPCPEPVELARVEILT